MQQKISHIYAGFGVSQTPKYEKMLKGGGLTGKNQTIKGNKTANDNSSKKPTATSTPTAEFRTGLIEENGCIWGNTAVESSCVVESIAGFAIRADIPLDYYGYWEEKKMLSRIIKRHVTVVS